MYEVESEDLGPDIDFGCIAMKLAPVSSGASIFSSSLRSGERHALGVGPVGEQGRFRSRPDSLWSFAALRLPITPPRIIRQPESPMKQGVRVFLVSYLRSFIASQNAQITRNLGE